MPPKETSPCVIGMLADVRSGLANLTAAGLQRKDLHDVKGKLLTPAEFEKHRAIEMTAMRKANQRAPPAGATIADAVKKRARRDSTAEFFKEKARAARAAYPKCFKSRQCCRPRLGAK